MRSETRQSTLAECFLYHAGAVLSCYGPCAGASILSEVNPIWRAGCGRSASPVRREGERNQSFLPTPIYSLHRPSTPLRSEERTLLGLREIDVSAPPNEAGGRGAGGR